MIQIDWPARARPVEVMLREQSTMARGEDIEAVRKVLGHSSRSVTERIYAHVLPSLEQKAGASLGFLLRKKE